MDYLGNLNPSWRNVAGVVVAYYGTLVFYRLFLHPLARFPGPKLAAISRWYEAYYDLIQGGQYTPKIVELHKQYDLEITSPPPKTGPIIRISPHELHVIDPAFFEKLYRQDGHWDKPAWNYGAFGAKVSTIFCTDHATHKARRHAIASFFSKAKVTARQELIRQNVDKLCGRIFKYADTTATFNLGAAVSAYTRDTANEFIVGKKYNELDEKEFGVELSHASQGGGLMWRTTKHIRWFGPTIRSIPIDWVMKSADEGTKAFLRYLQQSEQDTKDTLAGIVAPSPSEATQNTMAYDIVNSKLPPSEKTFDRIFEEIATVTGAAFETTASTIRLILFHVFSNKEILERLRAEVTTTTAKSPEPAQLQTLEQLPYLTAVLMEGLRMSPGLASRTPRVSDKDLWYSSWRIPAGTPVGMTVFLMHTDEALYPEPTRFDPERWVGAARKTSEKTFAPFSRGTRICLGMYLAWAEMYLVLAALVQNFDFEFPDATAADFEFESDRFTIGTKAGCNLMARVTPREV
ncbi:Trichodiene oxygenase [Cytospora mali]|uniref:Trichodiene oxygenase n=1 Tax=Cytospora mali TaxID=578113 RepID=A0A194VTY0_CYTMA|nr:Trichodiene oxygenase [Valsa mali]